MVKGNNFKTPEFLQQLKAKAKERLYAHSKAAAASSELLHAELHSEAARQNGKQQPAKAGQLEGEATHDRAYAKTTRVY